MKNVTALNFFEEVTTPQTNGDSLACIEVRCTATSLV
jgi:hypothetical protein